MHLHVVNKNVSNTDYTNGIRLDETFKQVNTMEELLKKWAELEPERCEIRDDKAWIERGVDNLSVWMDDRFTDKEKDIILGAVIEAVQASGWDWRIARVKPDAWFASVYTTTSYEPEIDAKSNHSPTHALLASYLDALYAQEDINNENT